MIFVGFMRGRCLSRPPLSLSTIGLGLLLTSAAQAQMIGTIHDFTDDGFVGGVCTECHIPHGALSDRLYPRVGDTTNWTTSPARQCQDCHKAALSAVPTGGGWAGVTGVTPPDFPHAATATYENCGRCHFHQQSFRVPNDDCLVCHTTQANGGVFNDATEANLQIDRVFNGIGAVNDGTLMSQHNIVYLADGNFGTSETAAQNECKKCHGDGPDHPSDTAYLTDPDGIVYRNEVAFNPGAPDYARYEMFCLSCHDGVDGGGVEQFGGGIPAGQVAPSKPSNPAERQGTSPTAPPWVVPAVPPKDVNAGGSFANAAPFFDYYSTNGHGLADSIEGAGRMDVTCLTSVGGPQGCHSPHGTHNRFLVDDLFGPGLDTAGEFGGGLCLDCHLYLELTEVYSTTSALQENLFHGGWDPHGDETGGVYLWEERPDGMLPVSNPPLDPNGGAFPNGYFETAILPVYAGAGADIWARDYTPTLGSDYIMCVTCHDPHGTSLTHHQYDEVEGGVPPAATQNTRAMLRKFPTSWGRGSNDVNGDFLNDIDDPLCAECHSD